MIDGLRDGVRERGGWKDIIIMIYIIIGCMCVCMYTTVELQGKHMGK